MRKKIILPITPQSWPRATTNDAKLFRIPENCTKECGLPRRSGGIKEGRCSHALSAEGLARKKRLERYNEYKETLFALCKEKRFSLPPQGAFIKFFLPMPKRLGKKQRKRLHLSIHQQKPDLSNLLKAFEDSILLEDKIIGHYKGLGKYWVDFTEGWIEITLHPPDHIESLPSEKSGEDFSWAMFCLLEGKKITRLSYNPNTFIHLHEGVFWIGYKEELFVQRDSIFSDEDLLADDWVIVQ